MRNTEEVTIKKNIVTSVICDKCGKITSEENSSQLRYQYGYEDGHFDGFIISIDLCGNCIAEFAVLNLSKPASIENYIRPTTQENAWEEFIEAFKDKS